MLPVVNSLTDPYRRSNDSHAINYKANDHQDRVPQS